MKAFRIRDAESLLPMSEYHTDAFLLDSHVAGQTAAALAKHSIGTSRWRRRNSANRSSWRAA